MYSRGRIAVVDCSMTNKERQVVQAMVVVAVIVVVVFLCCYGMGCTRLDTKHNKNINLTARASAVQPHELPEP